MICACSMDKSSIKFWLLFDLKRYIVSCSDCTKSNIGGCKKGIDPAVQSAPWLPCFSVPLPRSLLIRFWPDGFLIDRAWRRACISLGVGMCKTGGVTSSLGFTYLRRP